MGMRMNTVMGHKDLSHFDRKSWMRPFCIPNVKNAWENTVRGCSWLCGRCRAHPCEANEDTPDETMLALFPDGYADGGIGRKPVYTHEDVRRGEFKTKWCQGRSRLRICGHFGIKINSNFFYFHFRRFGIFFFRGSERNKPTGMSFEFLIYSFPLPPRHVLPFITPTHLPPLPSPDSQSPASHPSSHLPSSAMLSTSNSSSPLTPRPILKQTTSSMDRERKRAVVHFPPSPIISKTFVAHSPSTYDRSPIVVAPNTCALPERGCPGRTYTLDRNGRPINEFGGLRTLFGDDPTDSLLPPPLVQDSSSSSDESGDGLAPLPPSFTSPDSKHRKRGVRRHHKQPSTTFDHSDHHRITSQYNHSSFSDSSLRCNLADEGCFGGF